MGKNSKIKNSPNRSGSSAKDKMDCEEVPNTNKRARERVVAGIPPQNPLKSLIKLLPFVHLRVV